MNVKHTAFSLLVFALTLSGTPASAFETETHALITQAAYQRSLLAERGPGSFADRVMLDRLEEPYPFYIHWMESMDDRSSYYQNVQLPLDGGADVHEPDAFERCQMREFLSSENEVIPGTYNEIHFDQAVAEPGRPLIFPIQNWLVRGAIREDDLGPWLDFLAS